MYLHIRVNLQMKGECFPAHPRAVREQPRGTLLFVLHLGQDRKETFLWTLNVFFLCLPQVEQFGWAHLALFRHSGYSSFEVRLFTQCREACPTRGNITRPPCTVSSSWTSLARLHLAHRRYLLAAFFTNPLVGRAVRWLATIQMVNNKSNYYAAINLVNYILTQAVCKRKLYLLLYFSFSFSASFSPRK